MNFVELRFLGAFACLFALHWALAPRWRKPLLLAASYGFYACWDWRFLGLILASTVVDYACGQGLGRTTAPGRRRLLLGLSLAVNLGLLFVFKYFGFFLDSLAALLRSVGAEPDLPVLQIILPVGISFYTFQTLSYTIDVYRGTLEPTDSPLDFALFVAFFPQLVAGPIVRASHFLPQLRAPRRLADVAVRHCCWLLLIGYFKKACVADNVARAVDLVYADPSGHATSAIWLAMLLFTIQIYCDFSGYSDIAIGVGGLLGYQLPVNFAHPFFARSLTSLWRRWHVSLTTWLRDYLYIPLGGNRRGRARTLLHLVITFTVCGLWHGAEWRWVVWGAANGAVIAIERVLAHARDRDVDALLPAALAIPLAFLLFVVGLVFVRAPSIADAAHVFTLAFAGSPGARLLPTSLWLVALALLAAHALTYWRLERRLLDALPEPLLAIGFGAASALVMALRAVDYQPFYYFQF